MIKRPLHVWSVFLLCVIGLVAAMSWLSYKTIELDSLREKDRAETEVARQESELQERIGSALYRMDLMLIPVVSQEAARPHYFYESFYLLPSQVSAPSFSTNSRPPEFPRQSDTQLQQAMPQQTVPQQAMPQQTMPRPTIVDTDIPFASPLLLKTPRFVKLHFEIRPDGELASPQLPQKLFRGLAPQFEIDEGKIKASEKKLEQVRSFCSFDKLTEQLGSFDQEKGALAQAGVDNAYAVPAIDNILETIKQSKEKSFASNSSGGKGKDWSSSKPTGKVAIQKDRGAQRVNEDFNRRRDSTRNMAQQQAMANKLNPFNSFGNMPNSSGGMMMDLMNPQMSGLPQSDTIEEGVMQPIWIEDKLILARKMRGEGPVYFQCCWLDWDEIKKALRNEVADLLPQVDFRRIRLDSGLDLGTALTTLPVQLIVDSSQILPTLSLDRGIKLRDPSGLSMALLLAWSLLGIAIVAAALMLNGVMKLSERRGAFVSAVTHELRTPLTTFRMYAEMLAEKMVPPGKEQEYTNTLKVQADRLSHLVENVLQFARLEKSSNHIAHEQVSVNELVSRSSPRLLERAEQAGMKLVFKIDKPLGDLEVKTQPSNIEQILFNLVDNACKYAKPNRKNRIDLNVDRVGNRIRFLVRDFGPGIDPKNSKRMFQPFHKSDMDAANTAPGVGLGLALCKRMASTLGGRLYHQSADPGARFVLEIPAQG